MVVVCILCLVSLRVHAVYLTQYRALDGAVKYAYRVQLVAYNL